MKYILPAAVLLLVFGGFAYYTLFAVSAPVAVVPPQDTSGIAAGPASSTAAQPAARAVVAGAGSLRTLWQQGENLECQITYIPNPVEPEVTGTMFVYDGQLRGDFVVPTPDLAGQMVTSIIIANDTVWQWTDIAGELVGSQAALASALATPERLLAPIGFATEVQYDCLTWNQVDYTIFEPPSAVLFADSAEATYEEGVVYEEGEF